MTTNLFVIANIKQLPTYVVLQFYCLFSEHPGVLAFWIQKFLTVFTIRLSLARFWRAFGISGGGFEHPQTPPSVHHCTAVWQSNFVTSLLNPYKQMTRNVPSGGDGTKKIWKVWTYNVSGRTLLLALHLNTTASDVLIILWAALQVTQLSHSWVTWQTAQCIFRIATHQVRTWFGEVETCQSFDHLDKNEEKLQRM